MANIDKIKELIDWTIEQTAYVDYCQDSELDNATSLTESFSYYTPQFEWLDDLLFGFNDNRTDLVDESECELICDSNMGFCGYIEDKYGFDCSDYYVKQLAKYFNCTTEFNPWKNRYYFYNI